MFVRDNGRRMLMILFYKIKLKERDKIIKSTASDTTE